MDIIGNSQNISSVAAVSSAIKTDTDQSAAAIGTVNDIETANTIAGKADALMDHAHSSAKVYPSLAAGVVLTCGTPAWTVGTKVAIIPANTIAGLFDIHGITVEAASGDATFEFILYSGPGGSQVEIGRVRLTRITEVGVAPEAQFMCPIQAANTEIWGAIASSSGSALTLTVSLRYHVYG